MYSNGSTWQPETMQRAMTNNNGVISIEECRVLKINNATHSVSNGSLKPLCILKIA